MIEDIKIVNPISHADVNYIYHTLLNENAENEWQVIGEGCSAVVYKYKNYAIKDLSESGCYDGSILENFQDNPLFPKLYCYDGTFMVTEFLEIQSAYEYFERNVDIDYSAKDIFKYCYDKGYFPYDIHDDNVVVTKNDELKIIDVGSFIPIEPDKSFAYYASYHPGELDEMYSIIRHVKKPPIAI